MFSRHVRLTDLVGTRDNKHFFFLAENLLLKTQMSPTINKGAGGGGDGGLVSQTAAR